ncbi:MULTISPECIES: hypothetical protein [Pontibacillus]|uniref:Uncharacterized protein n=1 Tax=Pontibacillus chungwhensis TaxID=265426 RepID=A0ABY8V2U9_9BACI|nr:MULTISPECIES: hypothetical protein [Pontibacillus]MCD5326149.1 hypothetical protein [Pontibacillus sp. HN14]WIG00293.1 hypothetical protein QNI29_21035 [Pontibacillus chungwhensis]
MSYYLDYIDEWYPENGEYPDSPVFYKGFLVMPERLRDKQETSWKMGSDGPEVDVQSTQIVDGLGHVWKIDRRSHAYLREEHNNRPVMYLVVHNSVGDPYAVEYKKVKEKDIEAGYDVIYYRQEYYQMIRQEEITKGSLVVHKLDGTPYSGKLLDVF